MHQSNGLSDYIKMIDNQKTNLGRMIALSKTNTIHINGVEITTDKLQSIESDHSAFIAKYKDTDSVGDESTLVAINGLLGDYASIMSHIKLARLITPLAGATIVEK